LNFVLISGVADHRHQVFVRQKVKPWEVPALKHEMPRDRVHELFQVFKEFLRLKGKDGKSAKLGVSHWLLIMSLRGNFHKALFYQVEGIHLFWHDVEDFFLTEDRHQVSPIFSDLLPIVVEL